MEKFEEMVCKLIKNPDEIMDQISKEKINLIHMILGVAGEAGELVDAVKKICIYDQSITQHQENLIEELGDIEFYLCGIRKALGVSRETVIQKNMDKLSKRYPDGYSDELAYLRKDKN